MTLPTSLGGSPQALISLFILLSTLAYTACEVKQGASGDACTRTTHCAQGLACIERECSDDLGAVAAQSDVPELMMMAADAAAEPIGDASMMGLPDADR